MTATCQCVLHLDMLVNHGGHQLPEDTWTGLPDMACALPEDHDGPHSAEAEPVPIPLDAPESVWQDAWECSTFESEHWPKGGSWVDDDDHTQGMTFACGHCGVHSKVLPDGTCVYDGDIF